MAEKVRKNRKKADEAQKLDELLSELRENYRKALDATSEDRDNAIDDLEFLAGNQWPETIRRERERDGRPCLVINRLPGFVDQVVGDQRQNRPGIKVRPVDDDADPETAEMLTGLIRNIEQVSEAEIAYDLAFEHAVSCGFGFIRLATEYAGEDTFDQEIRIKPITNNFAVHFDPAAKNPITMEDARWCIITYRISREEFEKRYPNHEPVSQESSDYEEWVDGDELILAEYFKVEEEPQTLYLLPDGTTTTEEPPKGVAPLRTRTTMRRKVMRYLCTGNAILEGPSEWPGKYIPVVPVWGKEEWIKGERHVRGLIRHAKDAQRMYNYWRSAATETVALAPRAPFIGTVKQFANYEHIWDNAHRRSFVRLPYNPDPQAPGPPERVKPPTIPTGLAQEALQTSDEMKATTGIFDASLGARSNETSGKAINARVRQGNIANFAYIDNLARALRMLGRQLIDLIPKVYDTPRVVRIIGIDGAEKWVKLYEPYKDTKTGKVIVHDPGVGKYDVTVDVGPSYATKREEAATTMMEIIRAAPNLASITLDLVAEGLDWPNKDKFVERLKKALPPQLREQDDDEVDAGPSPEEMAAIMQQQQAVLMEMQKELLDLQKKKADLVGKNLDNTRKAMELGEKAAPDLTGQGVTG